MISYEEPYSTTFDEFGDVPSDSPVPHLSSSDEETEDSQQND